MNLLLYFLLAHFLVDYPLQPGWLVAFKMRSFWGVLLHTFIHLAVLSAILLPFWGYSSVRLAIGIIFVTHTAIDQLKCYFNRHHAKHRLLSYWADQILHWAIIFCLSVAIGNPTPFIAKSWMSVYLNMPLLLFILILVLCTYFYDISRWFWRTRKTFAPYKRDYRMMVLNGFIVTVAFVAYALARV